MVHFAGRRLIGVVTSTSDHSDVPQHKLKPIDSVLDTQPLLSSHELKLLDWCASYYHYPLGEVISTALPMALRQGKPAQANGVERFALSASTQLESIKQHASKQLAIAHLLKRHPAGLSADELNLHLDNWRPSIKKLIEAGLINSEMGSCLSSPPAQASEGPVLNDEQQTAVDRITAHHSFTVDLLQGVTGSGKTEVYIHALQHCLNQNKQALVLLPEIGLTPQFIQRLQQRLAVPMAILHSGLNDTERLCSWLAARSGEAQVIVGTRSALFTPIKQLGLIIVDEEHDLSFKQQDGLRYHARDVAIKRAQSSDVPILLGSATPSLESTNHALHERYSRLLMTQRAVATAQSPKVNLVDLRNQGLQEGVSNSVKATMHEHLKRGEQVMLFLNRRGYAPVLMCHDCGWRADCSRCDAPMTLHARQNRLICHHCGHTTLLPKKCPGCESDPLHPVGQGTQRLEEWVEQQFPDYRSVRIDRDSTQRKGALEQTLKQVHDGDFDILLGTQMLAKGHDFPNVTLVVLLDIDQGLFSADFRAAERMAQLITQVAGRAGRGNKPGTVMIQTHQPDHPLLQTLIHNGYDQFSQQLLRERQAAEWPPFSHLALMRAEAKDSRQHEHFLEQIRSIASNFNAPVQILGPLPAPMPKRAGFHRSQLLFQAKQRADLHPFLAQLMNEVYAMKGMNKVRWSLDVDPMEMY